ncbi:MAG: PDZ domain-containing protein [Vampirovibrio sp.]|nr:PDZ domain-containing protein [Vampirovibrio sp.]
MPAQAKVLTGGVQQVNYVEGADGGSGNDAYFVPVGYEGTMQQDDPGAKLTPAVQKTGEAGVVGMDIRITKRAYPTIMSVFEGSPAYKAGIRKGDRIMNVDGQIVYGKSKSYVDAVIPNIPGAKVTFTLRRGKYKLVRTVTVAPMSSLNAHTKKEFLSMYELFGDGFHGN